MILGIVAGQMRGAGGDPYWANVVSLLHFDGANGGTTFTDQKGKVWSAASGNPVINTDYALFGGSSGYFSGTATLASSPSSDWAFRLNDFTIELWFRNIDLGTSGYFDSPVGNWALNSGWCFFIRPDGTLQFQGNHKSVSSAPGVIANAKGQRIAASRVSGVLYLFVDGELVASGTLNNDIGRFDSPRIGGNLSPDDNFEGWIDEMRITKGVGRYTTSYALSPAPFPNS